MKKNLKVNLIWFGLIIGLFLILKGLELSSNLIPLDTESASPISASKIDMDVPP